MKGGTHGKASGVRRAARPGAGKPVNAGKGPKKKPAPANGGKRKTAPASVEPVDQGLAGAFLRDRTHLQGEVEAARNSVFEIPEEGPDGGEAVISSTDAVVTILLQGVEEGHQERHRQVLDLQPAGAHLGLFRRVEDEER